MRYRYEPPEEPEPWPAFQPIYPESGDPYQDYPTNPDYPTDPDYPTWLDEPADAARTQGLRRLSRLTLYAAQLSTAAAVGFTVLFAHAAHTQAVTSPAPVRTSPAPSTASPTPAASAARPAAKPSASASAGSASASGNSSSPAAPAPTRTLAPPTTAPAPPPPSPAPVQTTSSGTVGG